MKKLFIFFSLFITIQTFAQKSSDKTVTETCNCIKKGEYSQEPFPAAVCLGNAMKNNMAGLKAEFGIKTTNPQQEASEIGEKLKPKMAQCPEFVKASMEYMSQQQKSVKKDINTDTLKLDPSVCNLYKTGKMKVAKMYMNYSLIQVPGGAYSEIKDGFFYDYEENGKYMTKWALKWLSDCQYEQTLVETNSPNVSAMFKKGDKITTKAIGSTKDKKIYWFCQMMGMDFIALAEKMK